MPDWEYVVTLAQRELPIDLPSVDPAELRELLIESWRHRAPKRLVAEYDAAQPGGSQEPGSA